MLQSVAGAAWKLESPAASRENRRVGGREAGKPGSWETEELGERDRGRREKRRRTAGSGPVRGAERRRVARCAAGRRGHRARRDSG